MKVNGFDQYTKRQRIALDRPCYHDLEYGFVSKDPFTRRVQAIVEPKTELLPLGTAARAHAKNKHFQFSTILVVDMETPTPMWHAHGAIMDTVDDRLVPLAQWRPWMVERVMPSLINLLPHRRPDFKEKARLDKQKYSLHMRLPVTEIEKSHLIAREWGAVPALVKVRDPKIEL